MCLRGPARWAETCLGQSLCPWPLVGLHLVKGAATEVVATEVMATEVVATEVLATEVVRVVAVTAEARAAVRAEARWWRRRW